MLWKSSCFMVLFLVACGGKAIPPDGTGDDSGTYGRGPAVCAIVVVAGPALKYGERKRHRDSCTPSSPSTAVATVCGASVS